MPKISDSVVDSRTGKTWKNSSINKPIKDDEMVGKRFGKRTVLRRCADNAILLDKWLCKCDCGKEQVIQGEVLRRGKSRSCLECRDYAYGQRMENLIGRKFGKWTVVSLEGKN